MNLTYLGAIGLWILGGTLVFVITFLLKLFEDISISIKEEVRNNDFSK